MISGFPEYLPNTQALADKLKLIFKEECEKVGALHIQTPAVERVKTLQDKGSDNKEIYQLTRLADTVGGLTDLALRFDHTVPLARYASENERELAFPFMRYAIGPVWRGERAQQGRYRQFDQLDIDVIGKENLSLFNDALMPSIIYSVFNRLNIGDFVISINNRKILCGFLEGVGFSTEQIGAAIKAIDDIEKVGENQTVERLFALVDDHKAVQSTLDFFNFSGSIEETFIFLRNLDANKTFTAGVKELQEVIYYLQAIDVPATAYRIDLKIARGLDYYTGTVYETKLLANPEIGSICSGGRYDTLLQKLGAKSNMPGVGISIGATRLLYSLVKTGLLKTEKLQNLVLITTIDPKYTKHYLGLATKLRQHNIPAFLFTEQLKLAKQIKYAEKRGIRYVLIAGENEFESDTVLIRDIVTGEQQSKSQSALVGSLTTLMQRAI